MKSKEKVIINGIFLILFVGIFLIINIHAFNSKSNNRNTTTTTSKVIEVPVKDIAYEDTIYIDSIEQTIYVVEYISHLGFKFKYESEIFDIKHLSNGSLIITSKEDENNYIKFEKLQEKNYYKQYEELNLKEDIVDNYLINYKFLRGGSYNYLKVTKSISQDNINKNTRMDYIINSLSFTS